MILILTFIMLMISMIMMTAASILSKKQIINREKNSPFECGFDPKTSARIPFSIQFFLIAMIFLIFDVEITLLIPLIETIKMTSISWYSILTTSFIIILISGTLHEWNQGALDWLK
uniref:NADH-ubiquinone oxidoreductase chain 3 n=1 Tax=Bostrichoidea sp. 7 KM-2017 TaxID=2219281 RepID=A0A346RGW3_9COLE|nr:NADH dehydrogenase subunit 3 [Bostrichoidea sp. 7 KM-2017]